MPAICFYFQVHQPYRLRRYTLFDIGVNHAYFDEAQNRQILERVAERGYLRTNLLLREITLRHPQFRCAFSLSGSVLEQLSGYAPRVLDSFRELVECGAAEILGETEWHSLASEVSQIEFADQVRSHRERVESLFGVTPRVFRNTELVFHDRVAAAIRSFGYEAMLCEGAERLLGWRSPNYVYRAAAAPDLKVLARHYRLSDDIAFRFSSPDWSEYPLTASRYADWLSRCDGQVVNLFMDYETFGEHHWQESGILHFLDDLPEQVARHENLRFAAPSDLVDELEPVDEVGCAEPLSWADSERDLSAWLGNRMQTEALSRLYALESRVRNSGDPQLIEDWRKLQTSDHFYYMCTKWFADGAVHKYFSPYESPYDAFVTYNNVLKDLQHRCHATSRSAMADS